MEQTLAQEGRWNGQSVIQTNQSKRKVWMDSGSWLSVHAGLLKDGSHINARPHTEGIPWAPLWVNLNLPRITTKNVCRRCPSENWPLGNARGGQCFPFREPGNSGPWEISLLQVQVPIHSSKVSKTSWGGNGFDVHSPTCLHSYPAQSLFTVIPIKYSVSHVLENTLSEILTPEKNLPLGMTPKREGCSWLPR